MDVHNILNITWKIMNSPIGITAAASVGLWLLNRLRNARPSWRRWEGTIITAIKLAEKTIPDSTSSSGLAKLDHALRYVLRVYEETNKVSANSKVAAELKEGIQITHKELESKGIL